MFDQNYYSRYLKYFFVNKLKQSTEDYKFFHRNLIKSSDSIFNFGNHGGEYHPGNFEKFKLNPGKHGAFEDMLSESETMAFIIIKDDQIFYEYYDKKYSRNSIFQIFSISKSFTSALVGLAINDGLIKNLQDPITDYLDLSSGFKKIKIEDLLDMHSGIGFKEGHKLWNDEPKSYLSPSWKELLYKLKVTDEVGEFFHYNDFHMVVLSSILRKVLNTSISSFFEEKIWRQIGTEFPAYICVDNQVDRMEKTESGFVCTPIDLAKFGRLYLNKGNWNGIQVIPEKWVDESTGFQNTNSSTEYFDYYKNQSWGKWFNTGLGAYNKFWWGYKIDNDVNDYFAMGVLGQILYISPRNNAIGIRIGNNWGIRGWWPTLIKEIIESLGETR